VSILNPTNLSLVGTAVANAQGSWTFMKFGLTSNSFVLTSADAAVLTATDAAGNSSATPKAVAAPMFSRTVFDQTAETFDHSLWSAGQSLPDAGGLPSRTVVQTPATFDYGLTAAGGGVPDPGAVVGSPINGPVGAAYVMAAALEPVQILESPSAALAHLYNHPPLV
jgi:hypothetical protein